MGFSKLKYTKDWRNEDDFPAVVTDETQVRADQQLLFEEVKEHVNKVADELDVEKQRVDETMATKEELRDLATTGVADGAVTPQKLSPEVLDRSYTKEETWTEATKAEYGLAADAVPDAVPDAALSALAPLLHNWWAKKKEPAYKVVTCEDINAGLYSGTAYYADGYVLDTTTGLFRLLAAKEFKVNYSENPYTDVVGDGTDLTGKYFAYATEGNTMLYRPRAETTYDGVNTSSDPIAAYRIDVLYATLDTVPNVFEHDIDPEKFSTGKDYTGLGTVLQRAATAPKMAWGTFVSAGSNYDLRDDRACEAEIQVGFDPVFIVGFGADPYSPMFVILPQFGAGVLTDAYPSSGVNYFEVTSKNGVVRCRGAEVPSGYYFAIGL